MTRIGFGQADITPVERIKPGGVHDPLRATACVIRNGTTSLALVGIDSVIIDRHTCDTARAAVTEATSIPAANILISASHTHTGGPMLGIFGREADPKYAAFVATRVASAVCAASNDLRPATIGVGTGAVTGIHFNRRFLMRDGRQATHPGKMNPDIVRPAGPVDPDVGVLAARDPDGRLAGVVVHFGCHSTVISDDSYSADYAFYLREHLRKIYSPQLPVVFLAGASGDVTQVNNLAPGKEFGHEWGNTFGATLASEAARTIARMTFQDDVPLATHVEKLPLRVRDEPDIDRERPAVGLGSGDWWEETFANERRHVTELRNATPVIHAEIQSMRIGPLGIVTNGGELFCQPSLDIKSASPMTPTWVVTLANEYLGYIPTADAFFAGGYEPRTARSSFLAPDSAQQIVQASLRGLRAVSKH